jgi:AmiR/NasT family two-component response regulator
VTAPRLLVLADDLIWATRLEGQGRTLGARVERFSRATPLIAALTAVPATREDLVAIDATARAYDAEAAVREAAATGARVLALVQHDDPEARASLIAAGAERAMPYRALFERGHAILAGLLNLPVPPATSPATSTGEGA